MVCSLQEKTETWSPSRSLKRRSHHQYRTPFLRKPSSCSSHSHSHMHLTSFRRGPVAILRTAEITGKRCPFQHNETRGSLPDLVPGSTLPDRVRPQRPWPSTPRRRHEYSNPFDRQKPVPCFPSPLAPLAVGERHGPARRRLDPGHPLRALPPLPSDRRPL